jgi:hypothetical protein
VSETDGLDAVPEHAYQVTHYIRPAGNYGSWSQVTSGQLSAQTAVDWITSENNAYFGEPLQVPRDGGDVLARPIDTVPLPEPVQPLAPALSTVQADGPVQA